MPDDNGKPKPSQAVVDTSVDGSGAVIGAGAKRDPVEEAMRNLENAKNALADAEDEAKRNAEIAKAIAQYRSEQLQLEADAGSLAAQLREAREELKPTDAERAATRSVNESAKDAIESLDAAIKSENARLEQSREEIATTARELAEAKIAFEALKAQGKGIKTKHGIADALRKEAFDAIAKQKRHLAYFLLKYRLGPQLEAKPLPLEVDEYITDINQVSQALGTLQTQHRTRAAAIKEKEGKLADDVKALAELRKNLETNMRAELAAKP